MHFENALLRAASSGVVAFACELHLKSEAVCSILMFHCLCVSSTIITASIIVLIIISVPCKLFVFHVPLVSALLCISPVVVVAIKNRSMHTAHTYSHTISNLQINDCIIQSASEVHTNDMSLFTMWIAKYSNNNHVIHIKIAYYTLFFWCFFFVFFFSSYCRWFFNFYTVCARL